MSDRDTQRARDAIEEAGGIAGQTELAAHWRVSRQRAAQLVAEPGFPDPLPWKVGGRDAWLVADADEFRANRRGPGRPPRADAAR